MIFDEYHDDDDDFDDDDDDDNEEEEDETQFCLRLLFVTMFVDKELR